MIQLQHKRSGAVLVGKTICDHEHLGRVLAERYRKGPLYIWDVLDRVRASRLTPQDKE
jgi:hypothetical protein